MQAASVNDDGAVAGCQAVVEHRDHATYFQLSHEVSQVSHGCAGGLGQVQGPLPLRAELDAWLGLADKFGCHGGFEIAAVKGGVKGGSRRARTAQGPAARSAASCQIACPARDRTQQQ